MLGVQTITKCLPKTGTQVITVLNNGAKVSKTIIPGAGNRKSNHLKSLVTTYRNRKPQTITRIQADHRNKNFDISVLYNKMWEGCKEKFKILCLNINSLYL